MLQIQLLKEGARPPQRTRPLDAAYDLYCCEQATLPPGRRCLLSTGIAIALPDGYCGLILPRSGLALKHGITIVNAPGLIDPSYRGEIGVIMQNSGHEQFIVKPGDRIAQLLLTPFSDGQISIVEELPASADGRQDGGFGSSGR